MEIAAVVLLLLGGLGVLMVGMNMMSDNMSKLAHGKLAKLLNKTANNRLAGAGIGAVVTGIIQSSAATTVMVVGLVNAGIMTLFQATSIIMGANIGTTITAHLASLAGFKIVSSILFVFAVVGVFMNMLSKKEIVKILGNILTGLGLIFVGLEVMSSVMTENVEINAFVSKVLQAVKNPFLLILIGAAVTAAMQSSSAVTSIIIVLSIAGIRVGGTPDGVYFVIIGSNIGTCITALLSSVGTSTNAKRAALIHLLFNTFGAVIFTLFLLSWNWAGSSFTTVVLDKLFPNPGNQIAMFHTIFNVICTAIFLPMSKVFVKIAEKLIKEKKKTGIEDEADELLEIPDDRLLSNPSVALNYTYEKAGKIFGYAMKSLDIAVDAFLNKDESVREEVLKINSNLAIINKQEVDYLVKLASSAANNAEEEKISALHYVYNDIVRVGDLATNVCKYTAHYVNDHFIFSKEFLTKIKEMYEKIQRLFELSKEAFTTRNTGLIEQVNALEDEIDEDRRALNASHIARLNEGKCQPQNSTVFINLVGNLERAADHITFIARSVDAKKA